MFSGRESPVWHSRRHDSEGAIQKLITWPVFCTTPSRCSRIRDKGRESLSGTCLRVLGDIFSCHTTHKRGLSSILSKLSNTGPSTHSLHGTRQRWWSVSQSCRLKRGGHLHLITWKRALHFILASICNGLLFGNIFFTGISFYEYSWLAVRVMFCSVVYSTLFDWCCLIDSGRIEPTACEKLLKCS